MKSLLALLLSLTLLIITGCTTTKSSAPTTGSAPEVQTPQQQVDTAAQPAKSAEQVTIETLRSEVEALKAKIEATKPQESQWVKAAESSKVTATPPQTVVPPNATPPQVVVEAPKATITPMQVQKTPANQQWSNTAVQFREATHTIRTEDGAIYPRVKVLKDEFGGLLGEEHAEPNEVPTGFVLVKAEVNSGVSANGKRLTTFVPIWVKLENTPVPVAPAVTPAPPAATTPEYPNP